MQLIPSSDLYSKLLTWQGWVFGVKLETTEFNPHITDTDNAHIKGKTCQPQWLYVFVATYNLKDFAI